MTLLLLLLLDEQRASDASYANQGDSDPRRVSGCHLLSSGGQIHQRRPRRLVALRGGGSGGALHRWAEHASELGPVVERVHEGCHNHIQGVQFEGRERGIPGPVVLPVLLVETEASEHRPGIAAGTDERGHTRELFRLHEGDHSVACAFGRLYAEGEADKRSKCMVPLVLVRYASEDEEEEALAEQRKELRPQPATESEFREQDVA